MGDLRAVNPLQAQRLWRCNSSIWMSQAQDDISCASRWLKREDYGNVLRIQL